MPKQSVVVYGPQACGKSVHAEKLRAHFGLAAVIDDAHRWNKPAPEDTLILTNSVPPMSYLSANNLRLVAYEELCQSGVVKDLRRG